MHGCSSCLLSSLFYSVTVIPQFVCHAKTYKQTGHWGREKSGNRSVGGPTCQLRAGERGARMSEVIWWTARVWQVWRGKSECTAWKMWAECADGLWVPFITANMSPRFPHSHLFLCSQLLPVRLWERYEDGGSVSCQMRNLYFHCISLRPLKVLHSKRPLCHLQLFILTIY